MHSPGNNSPFNYEWRGNTARVLFKIKRATEGGRGNEKKRGKEKIETITTTTTTTETTETNK